jgi:hypothetical protein
MKVNDTKVVVDLQDMMFVDIGMRSPTLVNFVDFTEDLYPIATDYIMYGVMSGWTGVPVLQRDFCEMTGQRLSTKL